MNYLITKGLKSNTLVIKGMNPIQEITSMEIIKMWSMINKIVKLKSKIS